MHKMEVSYDVYIFQVSVILDITKYLGCFRYKTEEVMIYVFLKYMY